MPMGGISSPDLKTGPFEPGTQRLVLLVIFSTGTLIGCGPLPALSMGGTSSPDPLTAPSESGMWRAVLYSAFLSRGMQVPWILSLVLRIGSTLFLGLTIELLVCGIFPSDLPLVLQSILPFVQCPTWMGGSGTQKVVYYTGYPMTFVQACIHPPF